MSTHTFIACVNKINKGIVQLLPRDDGTPQEKLTDDEIMDILENVIPKLWQEGIQRQQFDCMVKGQAKFISF
eukprot:10038167-Ditylum_brightwellii.AAC.1